jgi:hypothetical protein
VVVYEGAVTTPRNADPGGRSVLGDRPRGVPSRSAVPIQRADLDTGLAAGFAELTSFRFRIVDVMASETRSGN